MENLSILEFEPLFKATVWGGRRLETVLNKKLPDDGPFGESWEIVDLPSDQSVVSNGTQKNKTLGAIRKQHTQELLGNAPLLDGRFPLLFKFLDAQKTLSVQVHPDEAACTRLGGGARPKTEAWYIIDSEPNAVLYVGLKPDVDRKTFHKAIENGTVETLLHKLSVTAGDFIFLPSGTIHAIGAGIMLAEVQQSSDTTYRVFDWNRKGLDGKPRQLHVNEALESIAFGTWGQPPYAPPPSGRPGIACDSFVMESVSLEDGDATTLQGKGMLALMGIGGNGEAELQVDGTSSLFRCGQTRLVPAKRNGNIELRSKGQITILAVRIPT
jgi:mannose-6-phosphate isomerase